MLHNLPNLKILPQRTETKSPKKKEGKTRSGLRDGIIPSRITQVTHNPALWAESPKLIINELVHALAKAIKVY